VGEFLLVGGGPGADSMSGAGSKGQSKLAFFAVHPGANRIRSAPLSQRKRWPGRSSRPFQEPLALGLLVGLPARRFLAQRVTVAGAGQRPLGSYPSAPQRRPSHRNPQAGGRLTIKVNRREEDHAHQSEIIGTRIGRGLARCGRT
jgi:hypothetical protein